MKSAKDDTPHLLTLIIPNWNGQHHLAVCLPSLLAQDFQDFEVCVVDNASTDNSVAWLREHYPQVRLIENDTNAGLCRANNQGTLTTDSEFVMMLNNDTELEPDCLGHLVRAAQANPQVGMCATKMLLFDKRDMIESAGIVVDKSGIAWGLESGDQNDKREIVPIPVFGPCGGAGLYRREMLLEIGLFDPDFFVYLEDADVAWRGQWAGWSCLYVPTAIVYHAHSATIKEGSPFKTHLLGRNKVWMIMRNYPWPHILWYAPLILLYEFLAMIYAIVSRRGRYAWQGRWEAWRQLLQILTARRQVVRKISASEMIKMLHPASNPFSLFRRYLNISKAAISGKMDNSSKSPSTNAHPPK